MTINIEKMRLDIAAHQKQLDWETRKFIVSLLIAAAAIAGASAAVGNYLGNRPSQPQTIIIQQPPAPAADRSAK